LRVTGVMEFIDWLKDRGEIKEKQAAFAGMILTGLSRTDAETGETYLHTDLKLKNRTLYVGPLGVITLPPVTWASKRAAGLSPVPPR
jgi:hypothetical protein